MGVRDRNSGALLMTDEEKEAASKCRVLLFSQFDCESSAANAWFPRFLPCVLLLQSLAGQQWELCVSSWFMSGSSRRNL